MNINALFSESPENSRSLSVRQLKQLKSEENIKSAKKAVK